MGKKISEMTNEELLSAIQEMRAVPVPNVGIGPKRPKRLDEAKTKRKKSLFDQLEES